MGSNGFQSNTNKNNGGAYDNDSTHKSSYINTTKKNELDRTLNLHAKQCKFKYLDPLARRAWEATASRASQKSRGAYYKDSTHESSYINTTNNSELDRTPNHHAKPCKFNHLEQMSSNAPTDCKTEARQLNTAPNASIKPNSDLT